MTSRPWILGETTWHTVRDTLYDVAVLPWGATEAHNYHLPYTTDVIETDHVAARAAELAWNAGARPIVLPTVPFGVQSGQLDIPPCLHVNPSTQAALLADLTHTLAGHGIRKLVILNGHGGNDFRTMIRELQPKTPVFLCTLNWYAFIDTKPFFDEPGDHAGELETSMMLHVAPDLVRPLEEAGPGDAKRFRIAALRSGRVWAPRQWTQVTADTGVGNPRAATAEKGAQFFDAVTQAIAAFLSDLAAADLADLYE